MTVTRYRYVGVTDERITCDLCGKDELKSTVVLYVLDEDGNDDEIVYYGSSCAAKVLGRNRRGAGRKVLEEARAARNRLAGEVESARACVARYADVENNDTALVNRFMINHINAMWINQPFEKHLASVRDLLASRRSIIAEAELIGL